MIDLVSIDDESPLFPCWGRHSRMGHNTITGYFRVVLGTSVLCTIPALHGDDTHEPTPERREVVPMDGPAFYGFEVLDETAAMALLFSQRPRIYRPPRQIAEAVVVEPGERLVADTCARQDVEDEDIEDDAPPW